MNKIRVRCLDIADDKQCNVTHCPMSVLSFRLWICFLEDSDLLCNQQFQESSISIAAQSHHKKSFLNRVTSDWSIWFQVFDVSHNPELGGIIPEQIIVDWAEACLATQQSHCTQLPSFPFKHDCTRLGLQYLLCHHPPSNSFQGFTRKRSPFLHFSHGQFLRKWTIWPF